MKKTPSPSPHRSLSFCTPSFTPTLPNVFFSPPSSYVCKRSHGNCRTACLATGFILSLEKKGKKRWGEQDMGWGMRGLWGFFFYGCMGCEWEKGSVTAACCSRFIKSDSLLSLTSTPAARASPLPCYHSISPQACPIYSQPVYTCKNVALIIIFLGEKNCSHKWVFTFLNSWGVANRSSNYSMNHFSPFEKVSKDKM